jgi:hypothetical protein
MKLLEKHPLPWAEYNSVLKDATGKVILINGSELLSQLALAVNHTKKKNHLGANLGTKLFVVKNHKTGEYIGGSNISRAKTWRNVRFATRKANIKNNGKEWNRTAGDWIVKEIHIEEKD